MVINWLFSHLKEIPEQKSESHIEWPLIFLSSNFLILSLPG